jgi:hypothetical protein
MAANAKLSPVPPTSCEMLRLEWLMITPGISVAKLA